MFFIALVYYYFIIPYISKAIISTTTKGLVRNLPKFIYDEEKGFRGEYKTFFFEI